MSSPPVSNIVEKRGGEECLAPAWYFSTASA